MRNYIVKRLLLIPVTMFGILLINFGIVQLAPGGPVEYMLAQYKGMDTAATGNINAGMPNINEQKYQGAKGVPDDLVKELEKQFGFDKPVHERFVKMLKDYISFDFGKSYYKDKTVLQLIKERLPVSISLGLWSTLIIYLIAIPLGIKKAREDGEEFDVVSSFIIFIGSAIPVFLFAVLLIVLFAGGNVLSAVSAERPDIRRLGKFYIAAQNRRLLLASGSADNLHRHRRYCLINYADQKFFYG